ncbi:hypothetical protein HUN08_12495 [Gordonia sp. X0973]|uniref:hypothetical protein n=1 Tax=Gordonia sp. X0973 TaxID=2742602 RepID=UPI000F547B57|nr:hypothetical protein [Gordonia sp. X0973]QKT07915.1 hypothetical protein HUN08_12495 [Gordonia sp. X0973]
MTSKKDIAVAAASVVGAVAIAVGIGVVNEFVVQPKMKPTLYEAGGEVDNGWFIGPEPKPVSFRGHLRQRTTNSDNPSIYAVSGDTKSELWCRISVDGRVVSFNREVASVVCK